MEKAVDGEERISLGWSFR